MRRLILATGLLAIAAAPIDPKRPCEVSRSATSLISIDDYPSAALRFGWQGDVTVAYTIGTDGRPTKCTVAQSSGHDVLDAATCAIVTRRMCYKPAMQNGVAVESPGTFHFRWRLH